MKIVCDKCSTKYSIADEKVRGKVFKIRCKKCSHIIVVKGTEGAGADASTGGEHAAGEGEEGATMVAGSGDAAAAVSGDKVWYLVVNGEQIGPLTPAEVRAKHASGEVDVETYGWREGFGDWLRLGSIDDFRDLGKAAPAASEPASGGGETRRTDLNDVFASHQAPAGAAAEDEGTGSDLFGGRASQPAPSAGLFAAAAPAPADDLFGGSSGGGGGALFGGESTESARPRGAMAAAGGGAGGGVSVLNAGDAKLTGQRNENSVLFSLNNLQALATGGNKASASSSAPLSSAPVPESRPGYATSKNEGSGLIDIRAMAAATLSAVPSSAGEGGSDLPGFGAAPVFSPVVAAPIMMPAPSSGVPKWVWALVGGGALFVVGVVAVLVVVLTRAPSKEVVVAPPPAPSAGTTAAPSTNPQNAGAAVAPTRAEPSPGAAPATPEKAPEKARAEEEKPGKASGKSAKATAAMAKHERANEARHEAAAAPVAKAPEPAAPPPPPPAKKHAAKSDDLDALLDSASPGGSAPHHAREAAAPADDPNLPEQLSRGDVQSAMSAVKGRVQGCYDQFKVPGVAMVNLVIAKTGKVQSASVGGALSGTPTGDCVARAAKSASFKRFRGAPMSIQYPFMLR